MILINKYKIVDQMIIEIVNLYQIISDMSFNIADIFRKIPQQTFDEALRGGFLLTGAISTFYLFFGRLFSLPELIGLTIKNPISEISKYTITIISGFIFISSLLRTMYHEHLTIFYPFDQQSYFDNIQLLRLIICGCLVGLGTQYASIGFQNTGAFGVSLLSFRSIIAFILFFGTTILSVTYKTYNYLPDTPRILNLFNNYLPRNMSYESYLLVGLLIPFITFLISTKKSLKGLIESLILFGIGITVGCCLLLLGWSKIDNAFQEFKFSKKWTGQFLVVYGLASLIFGFFYLIVRYGFRKPLFSNALHDQKGKINLKLIIGSILAGLGFGMGGISFQAFLMTIPSTSIRILVFWGIPCVISIKLVQLLHATNQQPPKSD